MTTNKPRHSGQRHGLDLRPLSVGRAVFDPPLLCAPMAGVTHSALRRLVADFGGYGALYTEMLSPSAVCGEDLARSPFTKKRPHERKVVYQLRLTDTHRLDRILQRVRDARPYGVDINLGCPAPEIAKIGGGVALFQDMDRLREVIGGTRERWPGLLSVKCRLGNEQNGWREALGRRLRLFEELGVDMVAIHPRFTKDKLKRTARWTEVARAAEETGLPLVVNGDIVDRATLERCMEASHSRGYMLGRIVAVQPWIFAHLTGAAPEVDYAEVWDRLFGYVNEDFPPERAIGRIKEFTTYYARNFFFGHELYRAVQSASDIRMLYDRAMVFLSSSPRLVRRPSVAGI